MSKPCEVRFLRFNATVGPPDPLPCDLCGARIAQGVISMPDTLPRYACPECYDTLEALAIDARTEAYKETAIGSDW